MLNRHRNLGKLTALRREPVPAARIPCSAHVSPYIVKTTCGDYLQVLRLGGASFESADENTVNAWHELLNVLWRNMASPNVALWTHLVRRRERVVTPCGEPRTFADALQAKYTRRLAGETLM